MWGDVSFTKSSHINSQRYQGHNAAYFDAEFYILSYKVYYIAADYSNVKS